MWTAHFDNFIAARGLAVLHPHVFEAFDDKTAIIDGSIASRGTREVALATSAPVS
jgi:hypothetical protein